jgi:hypothetical protein
LDSKAVLEKRFDEAKNLCIMRPFTAEAVAEMGQVADFQAL